jgi:hypothetical protein
MGRKLLQDFKFSDGLNVPKGTYVFVANSAMHSDEVSLIFHLISKAEMNFWFQGVLYRPSYF